MKVNNNPKYDNFFKKYKKARKFWILRYVLYSLGYVYILLFIIIRSTSNIDENQLFKYFWYALPFFIVVAIINWLLKTKILINRDYYYIYKIHRIYIKKNLKMKKIYLKLFWLRSKIIEWDNQISNDFKGSVDDWIEYTFRD